jgi:hypothetical protein
MWFRLALLTGFVGLPFLCSAVPTPDAAPLAEWELHDSLGHEWSNELLFYTIPLKRTVEPGQPLAVTDGDGLPVRAQILERHPGEGGKVTAVRLALLTDLKPFQQRRFRLLAAQPQDPPSDLTAKRESDRWILSTSKIGVAVPAGSGRDARSFDAVPAPILAVRGADTDWVGQGWLTGQRKVVSWKSELLDAGPVLARARVTYDFGGGQNYVVEITLPAGQPVVLVREDRNLPDVTRYETDPAKGDVFHLALAAGLHPTHVYSKRGLGSRGSFVEAGPAFQGTYLTPAQMHWVPSCCNLVATWHDGSESAPLIGLFPRFLSHWSRPHHTFVPLAWDQERGLVARFFLNHGSREWGLMAGGKKDMLEPRGQGGEVIGGYFDALLLANHWGETPLDKVKDWVLDWGEVRYPGPVRPALPKRGRGNMPYFAEQFLQGGQKWHDTYIHVHQTWTGEGDAWAQYRQALAALPANQRLATRAAAAFVMYKQTDPDYWPADNWIGPSNPNMIFMGNAAMLLGAAALADHPMARTWIERGLRAVRDNLTNSTSPDGAWIECPGYDGSGVQPILRAAVELRRTGLADLFADGRLLKVALYHANLVTPPDPRVHHVRHLPEFGDCFNLQTDKHAERGRPTYWKDLVPVLQQSQPKEMGQVLWALGERTGPVPIVPIDGRSRQVAGFGAVFRHAFDTPNESYLAVHQDSFGFGHYHFDLGALYFFGKGAPLCVDWPSLYEPQITEAWMHNCVSVARMKRFTYRGRVEHSALSPGVDYTRSRVYYDRAFPPNDKEAADLPPHCWQRQVVWVKGPEPDGTAYLVVRDGVRDERPTDWNLWTLSRKLRLEKRRAEVTGLYGVDLTVQFFVGPDAVPATEMFGFGKPPAGADGGPARRTQPAPGVEEVEVPVRHLQQQNVVRLASPHGGEYGAVLYPRRPAEAAPRIVPGSEGTVTVSAGAGGDTVLVYPTERSVTVGGVSFEGRAGLVSRSAAGTGIHLLEGRSLRVARSLGVRGDGPVSVTPTDQGGWEIRTDGAARTVEMTLPDGNRGMLVGGQGVTLVKAERGVLTLRVAAGPCAGRVK